MTRSNPLRDALKTICNAQKAGKRQCVCAPVPKVLIEFMKLMQNNGYIADFTYLDNQRGGKVVINLIGRLNKAAVISPRFDISNSEIEKWVTSLLPSRLFGHLVITTSQGVMDHVEAQKKQIGGKVIGYFY
ncbi:Ribosomal protein S8 [Spironucleus salmonicida]|uniref:Ribosomal protein S15A n=1 Tax=Spironucleus salmonicida TaxID=348837 RepID=V6LJ01_9EUKA|nr:Ribosomal protein S8 [Spironucleus salmonicida]|eukprot:EST44318.1 Ribosomal protein S15A [Spironucleus salmonicida]